MTTTFTQEPCHCLVFVTSLEQWTGPEPFNVFDWDTFSQKSEWIRVIKSILTSLPSGTRYHVCLTQNPPAEPVHELCKYADVVISYPQGESVLLKDRYAINSYPRQEPNLRWRRVKHRVNGEIKWEMEQVDILAPKRPRGRPKKQVQPLR